MPCWQFPTMSFYIYLEISMKYINFVVKYSQQLLEYEIYRENQVAS